MTIQFDDRDTLVELPPFAHYVAYDNGQYSVPGEEPVPNKSDALQKICDKLTKHMSECNRVYAELMRYRNAVAHVEELESNA